MKKALLALVIFLAVPFSVSAQSSGHFLIFDQHDSSESDNQFGGAVADWTATFPEAVANASITGVFLRLDTLGTAFNHNWESVQVNISCDGGPISGFTGAANLDGQVLSSSQPTLFPLTSGSGIINATTSCSVQISMLNISGHGADLTYYGTNQANLSSNYPSYVVTGLGTTTNVYLPYFVAVTNGFQIIPTLNDSGVFLSGAVDFCNNQFASSTGIGATIMNGLCVVGTYLFIPNQSSLSQFGALSSSTQDKIPFSYFYQLGAIYDNLIATTSPTFIDVELPLHSIGIGSSTALGNFLPNVNAFSTTTIGTYIPDSTRSVLRTLMSSVIWLLFAYYAYGVVTRMMAKRI